MRTTALGCRERTAYCFAGVWNSECLSLLSPSDVVPPKIAATANWRTFPLLTVIYDDAAEKDEEPSGCYQELPTDFSSEHRTLLILADWHETCMCRSCVIRMSRQAIISAWVIVIVQYAPDINLEAIQSFYSRRCQFVSFSPFLTRRCQSLACMQPVALYD